MDFLEFSSIEINRALQWVLPFRIILVFYTHLMNFRHMAAAKHPLDLTSNPDSTVLLFHLEMELEQFLGREMEFIASLADAIGVLENELSIVRIESGCVMLYVELPDSKAYRLLLMGSGGDFDPKLVELFEKYAVTSVTQQKKFAPPHILKMVETMNKLCEPGRRLTWLHVSDLHARANKNRKWARQERVTDQFLNDIPKLLEEYDLKPDFVFFTGDLAFSGKKEEYEEVRAFINDLYSALPGMPKLAMVPGNHDVTRDKIDEAIDGDLHKQLDSHDAVHSFLMEDSDTGNFRRTVSRLRLENFFAFLNSCGEFGQPAIAPNELFHCPRFELGDHSIGIASLNSAWRSSSLPDIQRLIVGEQQLRMARQSVDDCDIRIALIHHPPESEWFRDFDRHVHRSLLSEFDFVLRGHEHFPSAIGVRDLGTENESIFIPAGALHNSESNYPNSFNVVSLNLDSGTGLAFFWRHYEQNLKWRMDVGLFENGRALFNVPTRLVARIQNPKRKVNQNAK